MLNLLLVIFAYLLGSIPFGLVLGKSLFNVDLRQVGSGNIGTTNAFRGLGPKGGLLVFLCDMLKGGIPVLIGMLSPFTWHPLLFGAGAVLGHVYPIYLKFKGGKAIATSFGIVFAFDPLFAILAISSFFVILYFSRMVSLASILSIFFAILISFFWHDWVLTIVTAIIWIVVVIRHKENIQRIKAGTESKIPFGYHHKR